MRTLSPAALKRMPLPRLGGRVDKNTRGRVLAVTGSGSVPGAPLLVAGAVLRSGAGKVQIAAPRQIALGCGFGMPEIGAISLATRPDGDPSARVPSVLRVAVRESDAVIAGPGHKHVQNSGLLAMRLLEVKADAVFIIDAVAIGALWQHRARIKSSSRKLIITPHHGELGAMLGVGPALIARDPQAYAAHAAAHLNCVVALKSAETFIVAPDGETWRHDGGCAGLATSGSGDVLAGLIAGFAARGASPLQATLWGVHIHAQAGQKLSKKIGPLGFLAHELLPLIPTLLR